MNILGINAHHGDVSAVFVRDVELIAAIEEVRVQPVSIGRGSRARPSAPACASGKLRRSTSALSPFRGISVVLLMPIGASTLLCGGNK
jgi:hypothetical protein